MHNLTFSYSCIPLDNHTSQYSKLEALRTAKNAVKIPGKLLNYQRVTNQWCTKSPRRSRGARDQTYTTLKFAVRSFGMDSVLKEGSTLDPSRHLGATY